MAITQKPNKRPIRNDMLGMIWNANFILEEALHPNTKNVSKDLFEKCRGIVIMAVVKAGAVLTVNAGTGILLAKKGGEGKWSPPVPVFTAGYSFGAVAGKRDDNVLIFIMDDESLKKFVKIPQTRMGVSAAFNVGKQGGELSHGMDLPKKGTVTVAISKGVFSGVAMEIGTLQTTRKETLEKFYGSKVRPSQILFEDNVVTIPEDSMIQEILKKLRLLANGDYWLPDTEDIGGSKHSFDLSIKTEEELASENFDE